MREAWRATLHKRDTSTRESSSASSPTLTIAFTAAIAIERAREGLLSTVFIRWESRSVARMLQLPGFLHAHPDDRAGAVLRAPGHSFQRVPPHPRAHRARAYGRSRDVPL